MQDYQDEVKDFFAVDKQLASELEYDMKKYNEQLAQEQELARHAEADRAAHSDARAPATQVGRSPASEWLAFRCALCFPGLHRAHLCSVHLLGTRDWRSRRCCLETLPEKSQAQWRGCLICMAGTSGCLRPLPSDFCLPRCRPRVSWA